MGRLAELQAQVQSDIMKGGNGALGSIKVPAGSSPEKRLSVYQNAYKLRLVSILEEEYPVLKQFMGEKDFWRMADRFIDACPSNHPNARMVPARLPGFLAADGRYRDQSAINEIAALENAYSCSFDAPDADLATMEALALLPPEQISDMTIDFAPAVRIVRLVTNAAEIIAKTGSDQELPQQQELQTPLQMLVWRQELSTKYRPLADEEFMLLNEAISGRNFGQLCEMAAVMDAPDTAAARMAGYVTQWIASEMVATLVIETGPDAADG